MNIDWAMEAMDTVASLLGKYGRWLNARMKRNCFIVWSFCVLYWAVRDFHLELYSQSIFCVFSLALHVYGYINWKNKMKN